MNATPTQHPGMRHIQARLRALGRTQREVARAWNTDPGTVSKTFMSDRPYLPPDRLKALAELIELPVDDVVKLVTRPWPHHGRLPDAVLKDRAGGIVAVEAKLTRAAQPDADHLAALEAVDEYGEEPERRQPAVSVLTRGTGKTTITITFEMPLADALGKAAEIIRLLQIPANKEAT